MSPLLINMNIQKINKIASLGLIMAMLAVLFGPFTQVAQAAALTALSDTMSTIKVSAVADHDIQFTSPTGVAAAATIILTFLTTFSIPSALDFTDIDVLDDTVNVTLAGSVSGATWAAVRTSATVITLTNGSGAVGAGSVIRIKIGTNASNQTTGDQQITNPASASTFTIIMSGTFNDTGTISITTIADDAVAVSGTVNQTITFAINANTIAFGTLDSAAARYANTSTGSASETVAHTLAVATNSVSGYTITVKGGTLTSGSFTITANGAGPDTSSTGTEQFGIYATKSGGSNGTIATPYVTGSSFGYDADATTATTFASGTSATATETYSLRYIANIAAITEAGSYTASLIYVATGNF